MSDTTHGSSPAQFASLFRCVAFDSKLSLGQTLSADWIAQVVAQELGKTADRIFTPLVTLAVFLGQVLSDDHSCRGAVARLLAWRASRGLPDCSPDNGGYCKARKRLPETLLRRLVRESAERLQLQARKDWLFHGRRVVMVDGTTVSMPDTRANQRSYPQHRGSSPASMPYSAACTST